jgi:hypothetical protein
MKKHRPGLARYQQTLFLSILFCALSCVAGLFPGSAELRAAQEKAPSTPRELTLEQYKAELDRCTHAIQQPSEIPLVQDALPPVWTVKNGTSRVQVPTERIKAQLQELQLHPKNPSAAQELQLRVQGMKKEALEMAAAGGTAPALARSRLENILSRKEFRGAKGPSAMEILGARIARWIVEKLIRLFSRLHIGTTSGSIFVWSVIGLAFAMLCYMAWSWLSSRSQAEAALPAVSLAPSDARQWVQEALAAAERGDYRAALHCAYWGAIARLEDLGKLSRDRARTPRESLRLLEHYPSEQRLLHSITGIFELVWYGYRTASPADWTGAKELLEKIGCLRASTAPTGNS